MLAVPHWCLKRAVSSNQVGCNYFYDKTYVNCPEVKYCVELSWVDLKLRGVNEVRLGLTSYVC